MLECGTIIIFLVLLGAFVVVVPQEASAVEMSGPYTSGDYTYMVSGGTAMVIGYTGVGGAVSIPSALDGYPVAAIGGNSFANSLQLTSVAVPLGVTNIGDLVFQGCTALTSVTIPRTVTQIGVGNFYGCQDLTAINVSPANPAYASVNGVLYSKNFNTLIQFPAGKKGGLTIPSTVVGISDYACSNNVYLTSITIPSGVTHIGNNAFIGCTALKSVTISGSVTMMGRNVFTSCTSLTSITFLGMAAPTTVGLPWIFGTAPGIVGHAYAKSNFPAPGGSFCGLPMGTNVNPSATHFVVSAPSSVTSGARFSITVTALDSNNNVATGYTGTVHFTSSDGRAVLPANYKFVAGDKGVHTFTNSAGLVTTGYQKVAATDVGSKTVAGVCGPIAVRHYWW